MKPPVLGVPALPSHDRWRTHVMICNLSFCTSERDADSLLRPFDLEITPGGFSLSGEGGASILAQAPEGVLVDEAVAGRIYVAFEKYKADRHADLGLRHSSPRVTVRILSEWDYSSSDISQTFSSCIVELVCIPLSPEVPPLPQASFPLLEKAVLGHLYAPGLPVKSISEIPDGGRTRLCKGATLYVNRRCFAIEMFYPEHADMLLKPDRAFDAFMHVDLSGYVCHALKKRPTHLQAGPPPNIAAAPAEAVVRISRIAPYAMFRDISAFLMGWAHLPQGTVLQRNLTMAPEGLELMMHIRQACPDLAGLQQAMRADRAEFHHASVEQLPLEEAPPVVDDTGRSTVEVQYLVHTPDTGAQYPDIAGVVADEVCTVLARNGLRPGGPPRHGAAQGSVRTMYVPMASAGQASAVTSPPTGLPLIDAHTVRLPDARVIVASAMRLVHDVPPDPAPPQLHHMAHQNWPHSGTPPPDDTPPPHLSAPPATPEVLLLMYTELELMGLHRLDFPGQTPICMVGVCGHIERHPDSDPAQRARAIAHRAALLGAGSSACEGTPLSRAGAAAAGRAALQLDPDSAAAHLLLADAVESPHERDALLCRASAILLALSRSGAPGDMLEAACLLGSLHDLPGTPPCGTRCLPTSHFCPAPADNHHIQQAHRPMLLHDARGTGHVVCPLRLHQAVASSPDATPSQRYHALVAMGRLAETGQPVSLTPSESRVGGAQLFRLAVTTATPDGERRPAARHRLRLSLLAEGGSSGGSGGDALRAEVDSALHAMGQHYWALGGVEATPPPPSPPPPSPPELFCGIGQVEGLLLLAREMQAAGVSRVADVSTSHVCQRLYQSPEAEDTERAQALCLMLREAEMCGGVVVSLDDTDLEGNKPLHIVAKHAASLGGGCTPHALDVLARFIEKRNAAVAGKGKPEYFLNMALQEEGGPSRRWLAGDLRQASDEMLLSQARSEDPREVLLAAGEVARRLDGGDPEAAVEVRGGERLRVLPLLQRALSAARGVASLQYRALLALGRHARSTRCSVLLVDRNSASECPEWKAYRAAVNRMPEMPAGYALLASCFDDDTATVSLVPKGGEEQFVPISQVRAMGESRFQQLADACRPSLQAG